MPVEFLLVGSGWRADFFIRIAEKLPDRFSISAIVTKNDKMRQDYQRRGFRCSETIADGIKSGDPVFAVVSVSRQVIHQIALELISYGLPVLSETPAAPDHESLISFFKKLPEGARYQVAEQYHLRPDHMARMACVQRGIIGEPVQALISLTNNYHAISLMRTYLQVKGDRAVIRARRFPVPGKPGFERGGQPEAITRIYHQTLATFEFGQKQGLYDFEDDQHRSYIRSQHIRIKGDNGEINNEEVRYLKHRDPICSPLIRINKGEQENMEGSGLKGILFEGDWIYRNPYPETALSDDEVAVAACLDKMNVFCHGGAALYHFADAAQDYYLHLLLEEAVRTGKAITAQEQPWTCLL